MKNTKTKNKKRFPIGEYKYAMKNVKADYLLECRSLQMEKDKLDAVIVEVGCLYSGCVVVQFFPRLFNYYFLLLLCLAMYDHEYRTKETTLNSTTYTMYNIRH